MNHVIKTYVWHEDKCFFVSTIERESSAMGNPSRYNETMVWEYNWDASERGALIHQDEAGRGSLRAHQNIVEKLHATGKPREDED